MATTHEDGQNPTATATPGPSSSPAQPNPQPQSAEEMPEKPSGLFRWQGLLGFIITLALIIALLFVYAGQLIKLSIEKGGSWYWGAEINVAKVEVDWSPFKLAVKDFQATDAKVPENNLVAFAEADVSVDLWQTLLGKTLIHQLVIDKVQVNQLRKSPGQVYGKPLDGLFSGVNSPAAMFEQSAQSLPDVDDLLKQSDLKTVKAGLQLQQTYKTEKAAMDTLVKDLPNKDKIAEYQQAIKKLTSTKINSPAQLAELKAEFDQLKAQFKADKNVLKQAKSQLKASKDNISLALKDLKDAPEQDWQDISGRYQLNSGGVANVTELIFGQQAKAYYEIGHKVYLRLKPMLDKMAQDKAADAAPIDLARGRFVHFAEDNPMPDWLVEKARISVQLAQGDFAIQIDELNAQHWLRNQPTELTVKSSNLLNSGALDFKANVALDQQQAVHSGADWTITGLALQQLPISESDKFNLTLNEAKLQLTGKLTFAEQQLDSQNQLTLNQSTFVGKSESKAGQVVVDILSGINDLTVDIDAKGDVQSPAFSIRSPLDEMIYEAVKQQLKAKLTAFKGKAQSGLQQKLTQQLSLNDSDAKALLALGDDFSELDKVLENLLKSKLNDKVKDTLKDKLFKKLGF